MVTPPEPVCFTEPFNAPFYPILANGPDITLNKSPPLFKQPL